MPTKDNTGNTLIWLVNFENVYEVKHITARAAYTDASGDVLNPQFGWNQYASGPDSSTPSPAGVSSTPACAASETGPHSAARRGANSVRTRAAPGPPGLQRSPIAKAGTP